MTCNWQSLTSTPAEMEKYDKENPMPTPEEINEMMQALKNDE